MVWFCVRESNGRCRVTESLENLPDRRRGALLGQMQAFADLGWLARVPFVKALKTQSPHTIYEIKCGQERMLYIRNGNNAIALSLHTKKDDWSRRDAKELRVVEGLAAGVLAVWK